MMEGFLERTLDVDMQEAQKHNFPSEDWAGGPGVLTKAIASHLQTVESSFRISVAKRVYSYSYSYSFDDDI